MRGNISFFAIMIIDFEELKEKIPIKEVVKDCGVKLNVKDFACCPFHHEKTPSFKVYDDRFQCFGCGEGGDVFDFVQKFYAISFKDAISKLDKTYKLGLDVDLSPEVVEQIRVERMMRKAERALNLERKTEAEKIAEKYEEELRVLNRETSEEHTPREIEMINSRIDVLNNVLDEYFFPKEYEMVILFGQTDRFLGGDYLSQKGIEVKKKDEQ